MKQTFTVCLVLCAVISLTPGCRSLFPSEDKRTLNTWNNFDEAQASFDRIVAHQTTVAELKKLGFDPHSTPNVKILTYLDVIQRFIPNQSITKEDLPVDIKNCLEAKDCCHAYELDLDVSKGKRYGNLFLDIFGFNKKNHITGWNFLGLIIIKDDLVIYKLRSGEPNVDRLEKRIKPLGPFQELDGLVSRLPGVM